MLALTYSWRLLGTVRRRSAKSTALRLGMMECNWLHSPCSPPGRHSPGNTRNPDSRTHAPQVIHVTHAEQANAIDRSSLVSLIRARLKEKTAQPGEYLFK